MGNMKHLKRLEEEVDALLAEGLADSNNCGQVDAPRLLVPGNMLRSLHEHGRKHGELPGYRRMAVFFHRVARLVGRMPVCWGRYRSTGDEEFRL
jgi:hypothetical protein